MTVTSVSSPTFISDATMLIRDNLASNITDPKSAARTGDQKFVMTAFPQRNAMYPLITVMNYDVQASESLGAQSLLHLALIPLEIKIYARTVQERDELTQQVIAQLRSVELSLTVAGSLFDCNLLSAISIDEPGEKGLHIRILRYQYKFILGA